MTDTLQTAELEQQAIEILDDYLDGGEYHEYTPLEKKRHAAHVLDLINSEVTKKLEAVLAVLPEKKHYGKTCTPMRCFCMYTPRNDVIDEVTAAITNLVAEERGVK